MSQAFSLYSELTVRQNLELHAQLYHLPANEVEGRIKELLERYDLKNVADAKPESLPLGVKQRLQLAVAVLHRPPMLILDEPTSGVDPVARDAFWRTLIDLSRNDGVTIFLSTHFMNEADRCDRISLMHRGKVLAVGAPKELVKQRGSASLEDAFISYLEEAAESEEKKQTQPASATRSSGRKSEDPTSAATRRSRRHTVRAARSIARLQAVRSQTAVGLCPARNHGALTRSHTVVVRLHRTCHFDVCLRLRDHVRCREPQVRGLRPGPDARKPKAAGELFRLALFLRTPADQFHHRARPPHAGRRTGRRR